MTLLGPVAHVGVPDSDSPWILQATYSRPGAWHVPAEDESGQCVTARLRDLARVHAVVDIGEDTLLNDLFGGACASSPCVRGDHVILYLMPRLCWIQRGGGGAVVSQRSLPRALFP